ncbi:MAG: TIGR02099 family protein [Gammaproteobacteria bacterium]|nr:TIGR02099 family protein [Gammaproteobacteria bacterium]
MELLKRISFALLFSAIVLLAVAMGGIRLVISNIEYFKPEIDYLLQRDVHEGIVFNRVSGSMNRFNPILRIENVSVNLPDRSQPLFIDRLEVEFDFWSSLRERAPVALEISGQLEKLELTKDMSGRWLINEYHIGAGAGDVDLPGFSELLGLLPRYLKLNLRRLIVHDQKYQATHQFDRVEAQINHREGQFLTQLSAALPDEFGRGVLLKSVVDPASSLIYINSTDLQLAPLARLFDIDTHGVKSGALDGELWVGMSGYRITAVNGNLLLKQAVLQVSDDKPPLSIDYHAHFNAVGDHDSWRINSKIDRLGINGQNVPGFNAQVKIPLAEDTRLISAWIDRLQLSSLPVVAGQWLHNTINEPIEQGKLKGLLQDLVFEMDLENPRLAHMAMRATDLSSDQFRKFPGATNLNADLVIGNSRLAARVYGEAISLDFGEFFRAPLYFDSVALDAVVNLQPSGNLLVMADNIEVRNRDASVSGRLRLETDGDHAPFMFLRANFSDAQASSAGKYFPITLLPAKTMEWLDRGIIDGFAPAGDLQFHGRLRRIHDFENNREGEFFVDFAVERADVFFAPGWLPAKNGAGRVLFHNLGVEFDLDSVSYERLDGIRANGRIANFTKASLELNISADAPTSDALRIWGDTPVGERFSDILANLHDLEGSVSSEIEVLLPLGGNQTERSVDVNVDFKNAALQAKNWGLDLSQITGRLNVTEDSLAASQVTARFFGDPVEIDASSENTSVNTRVTVQGNLESSNLLKRLPRQLAENVKGHSDWQIGIDIAGASAQVEKPFLHINAASNLQDTQITLALPMRKSGPDIARISADIDFFPEQVRFETSLGKNFRGRGLLNTDADREYRLDALQLAFSSPLEEELSPGINLHGRIAELPVDEWKKFFTDAGENDLTILNSVDLDVDRAEIYGRRLEAVDFALHRTDRFFYGFIDAPILRGSFAAPRQPSTSNPVIIDLEYLVIDKLEQEPDYAAITPSDLPAFRLVSNSLRYHDMMFSDLSIEARPRKGTLVVDKFSLRLDSIQIAGKAKWEYDATSQQHLSSIKGTIKGPQLGQAMAGLGFGDSMTDGNIDLSGSFTWPAPLYGFTLENVSGKSRMKITDGVLNNVEPGSGRFVGLLSLSAIPRRLALDFSDVLIDGMGFDKIDGNYRIANGVLFTEDTRMDGPAAKIKISGKTGIMDRDYDQTIRVTPKIRHTLPLVGAVAAGTTVGWGLLLLQNLFKKVIDDAVEVEYRVSGSWDDPKIDLIKAVDENQKELPKIDNK